MVHSLHVVAYWTAADEEKIIFRSIKSILYAAQERKVVHINCNICIQIGQQVFFTNKIMLAIATGN